MKPVVTYAFAYLLPVVGESAVLGGLRGHVKGDDYLGDVAQTSAVQRVECDEQGKVTEFETMNTIYRPEAK